jgi:hypothetical protein
VSVTVTVYKPTPKPQIVFVVDPLDHKYPKPPVLPLTTAVAQPSAAPLQLTFVVVKLTTGRVPVLKTVVPVGNTVVEALWDA